MRFASRNSVANAEAEQRASFNIIHKLSVVISSFRQDPWRGRDFSLQFIVFDLLFCGEEKRRNKIAGLTIATKCGDAKAISEYTLCDYI